MKLVAVSSSQNTEGSVSQALVRHFVDHFEQRFGADGITVRDIGQDQPPHLDQAMIAAFFTPEGKRSPAQVGALALSDELVDELVAADVLVVGSPMYNFNISSPLKAYIDHVVRAGRTFSYTESGPEGHLRGKKVFVLTARGGDYSEGSFMHAMDHQEPYLRQIFGFIGLDDVTFIHAQGLAMGEVKREGAIKEARQAVESAVAGLADPDLADAA